jgi:hypothetical protein
MTIATGNGRIYWVLPERINPKRAFLFVSKVLGGIFPSVPTLCAMPLLIWLSWFLMIYLNLCLAIMAETAVGLGAGVHQVLQQRYPEAIYVTTTRHPVHGAPLLARFLEEHSHAQDQLLYGSPDAELQQQILNSKSIVLVDDEASTGKTFVNLIHALQGRAESNFSCGDCHAGRLVIRHSYCRSKLSVCSINDRQMAMA